MKIGVIGHRGRIGSAFMVYPQCEAVDCDIRNVQTIEKALHDKKYDAVINCAAYTDVDGAERERLKSYSINTYGPANIANVYKGYFVHLSTDYIFDGISGPYDESFFASPISAYGFSKYLGEVGLRPHLDRTLIVRTTVIYDAGPRPNFVLTVMKALQDGKKVKAPKSLIGNPTYTNHLVTGILDCVSKNVTGILNISGLNRLSRFEMARQIAQFIQVDPSNVLNSFAWGDAKRPEKAGFILDKAQNLGVPLFTFFEGLHEVKLLLENQYSRETEFTTLLPEPYSESQNNAS